MQCIRYSTMCPSCKHYLIKLHNHGVPLQVLEHNTETYPIVFKCIFEYPPGGGSDLIREHTQYLLSMLEERLDRRFGKGVAAYSACEVHQMQSKKRSQELQTRPALDMIDELIATLESGLDPEHNHENEHEHEYSAGGEEGFLVKVSFLVDFPFRIFSNEAGEEDHSFKTFLRAVTSLNRQVEDWSYRIEVDEDLKRFLFGGLGSGWEAFISSTQDHLCMARLCWFLKREGLGTFI